MLGNDNRLTKKEDFDRVKEEGTISQSQNFAVVALKRGDKKPSRFGFIVSTKISKEAVIRNKVKRAFREAVRQNLVFIKHGYDFVFLARPETARMYTDAIMREVREHLKAEKFIR